MAITTVYIHGNGNKIAPDRLKADWDQALFGEAMGTRTRMAYFASLRYPQPLPGPAIDEVDVPPVTPLESAFVEDTGSFLAAVRQAGAADTAPRDDLDGWLAGMSYAADALAEGESAEPPPASPFEVLPFSRSARIFAFREFVKRAFKDVHAYFFGDFKEAMRDKLREQLEGLDGPVIVIAHSLGTIIAYDVLRTWSGPALEIPLLVTVGSPLGVREIQDLVVAPLEVPAGVAAWRNASDARDVVALDHWLRPEYRPADRCTDFLVRNDTWNHHGIRDYLASVPVREPVVELMRG